MPLPSDVGAQIQKHLDEVYADLTAQANSMFPQAYLAQLFKNQTKLAAIIKAIAASRAPAVAPAAAC